MKKVAVIGGGWSGLYALKHCLEYGLDATLFETADHLFGNWHFDKAPGGVIRTSHATSSKNYMQPSDFPFPDDTPDFPHHSLIEQHLENYVKHFNLKPHIQLKNKVNSIKKHAGKWEVQLGDGQTAQFDCIVVATGQTHKANYPREPFYKNFSGRSIHANQFQKLPDDVKYKNVLIIGGGEFAADIATEIADDCNVFMSIRGGQWFQEKVLGAYEPADMVYNRFGHHFRGFADLGFRYLVELFWGDGGSGIKQWKPHSRYLNGFYNKSREIITKIAQGEIQPRGEVKGIRNNDVIFENHNQREPMDFIIFATGYSLDNSFKFLPENVQEAPRYKLIFNPADPTLAFIGFARPYLGSIPMLSELQARYIANVFSGQSKLPRQARMEATVQKDISRQKRHFPENSSAMPHLVDPYVYSDQLAKKIGAKPRMWRLLLTNPALWKKILLQPWSPFQYRVHDSDKNKRSTAVHEIAKLHERLITKKVVGIIWLMLLIHIVFPASLILNLILLILLLTS